MATLRQLAALTKARNAAAAKRAKAGKPLKIKTRRFSVTIPVDSWQLMMDEYHRLNTIYSS
jgi:hypothetical protein